MTGKPKTTPVHQHPDFANVVRVPRFHQAPQRIQPQLSADHDRSNVVPLNTGAFVHLLLMTTTWNDLPCDCAPPT